MNESNQTITTVGPSLTTLLTILFIALKLCGIITWSWWWVLSPIWISFGLLAIGLVLITISITLSKKLT